MTWWEILLLFITLVYESLQQQYNSSDVMNRSSTSIYNTSRAAGGFIGALLWQGATTRISKYTLVTICRAFIQ